MACGDRFRGLLKTADGRTPDNPCGLFCLAGDAERWHNVVRTVDGEVSRLWGRYQIETQNRGLQADAILVADIERYGNEAPGDVPMFGTLSGWGALVDAYVTRGEAGVCLMERIDDAVIALGGKPASAPGKGGTSGSGEGWTIGKILFWGAVAGGALWAVNKTIQDRKAAA